MGCFLDKLSGPLLDFGTGAPLECLHYLILVPTDYLLILLFHGSLKKPMSLGFVCFWGRESGIS